MKKKIVAMAMAAITALALMACNPEGEGPGGNEPRTAGMTRVTFVFETYKGPIIDNQPLNLSVHATIYLEDHSDGALFNVDGQTGASDIFPFDVTGASPLKQNVFYDHGGDFVLRGKASVTAAFGVTLTCHVEDIAGNDLDAITTTAQVTRQMDTITTECVY